MVGHNLKIAWNLMRMNAIRPKAAYRELAERIGQAHAGVRQPTAAAAAGTTSSSGRRRRGDGAAPVRLARPQGVVAAGAGDPGLPGAGRQRPATPGFLDQAREASAFYNAFFLDHDEGGVYFNVLASGIPYLLGTERLKGSHSMSMYHAAELCYLATVYQRLLLSGEPLTLWFRPRPDGFPDRVLRVAPDALPPGRVRLDWVEVDGSPYPDFDPDGADRAAAGRRRRPEGVCPLSPVDR